jgi:4-hydroxy-tetrahydrodipicolinate synthase
MTPCSSTGVPDINAMVDKAERLMDAGMSSVVYCGSMGEWPQLSDAQRQQGVSALLEAGVPVVVGTGAQNTAIAVEHARHAKANGARGLMIIPRVLSRGISPAAQHSHFSAILEAGVDLPSVIYNSPYYGFETKADLFFRLREDFPHLVGFKEFGGAASLSYAAEHITSKEDELALIVGVDTQVLHGIICCGAIGVITGVGNVLPEAVFKLIRLCQQAAEGNVKAGRQAHELDTALRVLSTFDEGPDLVLFYKYLLVLQGEQDYQYNINPSDKLSKSQQRYAEDQLTLFQNWWKQWLDNEF